MASRRPLSFISILFLGLLVVVAVAAPVLGREDGGGPGGDGEKGKSRIMVVSSYHREYLWSQETNRGLCAALLEFGYLDEEAQVELFSRKDYVESSRAIIKKSWMDTKRKSSKSEIAETLAGIIADIDRFKPDILLLGDDNAANYISNQYLDTEIPIVFWGINGLPLKYGIIDSLAKPGHNVTGVFQRGYHLEAFASFLKIAPRVRTIAVLADDSPTGRAHAKKIQRYAEQGQLPVEVRDIVITNSFDEWKARTLELLPSVDGFYISTHNTLQDKEGNYVDYLLVTAWYLKNVLKPELVPANFMVMEGLLCTVDDSAFKQGYEAMELAHRILGGERPADIPVSSPTRGPFIVNRSRAVMLGLEDSIKENDKIIDEYIDEMQALEKYPR